MTLREARAQLRDWARNPPLYEMVRIGLGIEAKDQPEKNVVATPEDVAKLAEMFNQRR